MILSVLHRDRAYIATTESGIYEASEADKVWKKMPTPISMPDGGRLAQESLGSPRLLYFTGDRFPMPLRPDQPSGSLYISDDSGKTWTESSIRPEQEVLDAFAQVGGTIFVVTGDFSTRTGSRDGELYYPSEQLLQSRDGGQTWRDITPTIDPGCGLFGLFPDPDHPNLVCVESSLVGRISRTAVYQAEDETYHWRRFGLADWKQGSYLWSDFFGKSPASGGTNNSNMPATLSVFFKFPYNKSGRYLDLPTKYLVTDKTAYVFHLNQPMPVTVTTSFLYPDAAIKWLDNKNEKIFWQLSIQPDEGRGISSQPLTSELDASIPNWQAKKTAYLNDPDLIRAQVDKDHPYNRVVDLAKLYNFAKPGHYQIELLHTDLSLDHSGSVLGTFGFDLSVLP